MYRIGCVSFFPNSTYAQKTNVFTNIYIKNIEQVFDVCVEFSFANILSALPMIMNDYM